MILWGSLNIRRLSPLTHTSLYRDKGYVFRLLMTSSSTVLVADRRFAAKGIMSSLMQDKTSYIATDTGGEYGNRATVLYNDHMILSRSYQSFVSLDR